MDKIQTNAGMQFTSKDFHEVIFLRGVRLSLAAPDHQEMNSQVEATWRKLRTITLSIMVHTRVSDEYLHFALMYMTDHIFPVIRTKHLVNQYGEPITPRKMETGTKPLVSNLHVLLCPCVARKATAQVDKKALNMHHQSQKDFCGIFIGFPKHQKVTSYTYPVHEK